MYGMIIWWGMGKLVCERMIELASQIFHRRIIRSIPPLAKGCHFIFIRHKTDNSLPFPYKICEWRKI
jgi:hypothetical protein